MINILHTIDTTGPGGAETVFLNLVRGLDRRMFHPTVAIPGKGWVYDEIIKSGIKPILLNSKGSFSLKYLLDILSIIKKEHINIIQSHLIGSNVYCSLAGMISRIPVISTIHGFVDMDRYDNLARLRLFIISRGSKRIVFVSNHLRDHYLKNFRINEQKAVTICNGIDLEVYRKKKNDDVRKSLGLNSSHMLIGSIGNIRESKGYDHLMHAAAQVVQKYPNCRFLITGEGSGLIFEHLLALKSRLGLDNKVFFLGYRHDVLKILNNLDIFVLPSKSEGFSIVTLEAMACMVPVVATKSGGPEEIVVNCSGLMVRPEDNSELASAIIRMIEDNDLRRNCTQTALDIVIKKFSKHKMLDDYARTYL